MRHPPQRPHRYAACEPYRLSKQSCDHGRPSCVRCIRKGKQADCQYRDRPFKRKHQAKASDSSSRVRTSAISHILPSVSSPVADDPEPEEQQQRYAGFIGASSHATIFDELGRESGEDLVSTLNQHQVAVPLPTNALTAAECVADVEHLLHHLDLKAVSDLIHFWLAKGTSMALAASLLPTAVDLTLQAISTWADSASDLCAHLHKLSSTPLVEQFAPDFGHFMHEVFANIRWEGILLFLIAAGRAVTDIPHFPILYNDRKARRKLQQQVEVGEALHMRA